MVRQNQLAWDCVRDFANGIAVHKYGRKILSAWILKTVFACSAKY